ncbi:diacylglycerol/lipid kinase family protein [Rubrivirga marina]|uniref:DAGKc domain-containing protein n=1 Tax=Rubrivirga marina TaxID=1196024 RepID=A0A271J1A2_9BACT|nr:diacylglycerol kinase family protein [Rubrivirga marina]PAP77028.1 hypothetical protein BSZ37_11590 [Rubrivirga marina]
MTAHVLVNPAARGGRNQALRPALDGHLAAVGIEAEVWETAAPGDAERMARCLGEEGVLVIVAGGDGTVHEVVNGLVGTGGTLAVLPVGTGNDYAHALGMADDLAEAARQVATAGVRAADVGRVRWTDADGVFHERLFANGLGLGFDARVAALASETKWLGGQAAYLAAVFRTLWAWRRPTLRARVRSVVPAGGADEMPALDVDESLFLCEIGNGHSAGGGFLLTPDATPFDGLLDVCYVRHVATARALRLLPTTFSGAHVTAPEVTMARVSGLTLAVEPSVGVHADGEILTAGAVALDVEVLPGAIAVVAPARTA